MCIRDSKYSKREGTKAAVMEGQVSEQVKARRSALMISLGEKKRKAYEESFVGKEVEVLVEEPAVIEGRTVQTGHKMCIRDRSRTAHSGKI